MGIRRFLGHMITGNCNTTLIHQPNSRSLVAYLVPRAARMGGCGQVTTWKSALFVSQTVLHLSNHLIFRWFDSENVCAVYSSYSTLLQGQHSPVTVLYSVPFKEIWSTIISFFFIITVLIDKMDLHSVWFPISTNSDLKARIANVLMYLKNVFILLKFAIVPTTTFFVFLQTDHQLTARFPIPLPINLYK